ncbi:MAG: deoxyguanosinetriphosphate triphosphohydrolase [Clostridiales bacterium]|nr:deoxyguanosinetriphosphate triphosphohydrolase [Clostridiales bacterium]
MMCREGLEEREKENLSPRAAKSCETKGRLCPEEKCSIRTDYQRDRDRIIHSKAFRRLMHKTQVFLAPEGDHFRTRLTHTIEVSQIARTIARGLSLNEDLTEAIALGHDLGHTPFGHSGEDVLDKLHEGGFKHNVQSLRVVDVLEGKKGVNGRGLNLTFEVRDGIACHTGSAAPKTLEGQVVRVSDRIAYINHDIDDALRSGIISVNDLPKDCIQRLGGDHSSRINTLVTDVMANSLSGAAISMSGECAECMGKLRSFMFEEVYHSPKVKKYEDLDRVEKAIKHLYEHYCANPGRLPDELRAMIGEFGLREMVKDYVAGMTDRFAMNLYDDISSLCST